MDRHIYKSKLLHHIISTLGTTFTPISIVFGNQQTFEDRHVRYGCDVTDVT